MKSSLASGRAGDVIGKNWFTGPDRQRKHVSLVLSAFVHSIPSRLNVVQFGHINSPVLWCYHMLLVIFYQHETLQLTQGHLYPHPPILSHSERTVFKRWLPCFSIIRFQVDIITLPHWPVAASYYTKGLYVPMILTRHALYKVIVPFNSWYIVRLSRSRVMARFCAECNPSTWTMFIVCSQVAGF